MEMQEGRRGITEMMTDPPFRASIDRLQDHDHDRVENLITAARNGDRDALGQAIEAYRRYLLTAAEHDLAADIKVKEGASDLVQETLCEAHRDFQRFDGQTEVELRAWLRRLLAFQVAHAARRYRGTKRRTLGREVPIETARFAVQNLVDDHSSPSSLAEHHEEESALRAALDRLPERMARVVLWRHREDCSFEKMAQRLGCSTVTARKLWLRVLRQLQYELKGVGREG